jgi:hypothetical protein
MTPALKAYKHFVCFAMLERFRSSELFKNNPHVDEILYIKDAWNDYPSFQEGCKQVEEYCLQVAKDRGYDEVKFINHSKKGSKIRDCAKALGVKLEDLKTNVYISDKDREIAQKYIPSGKYGFVHTKTGVPKKDLPEGYGKKWLQTLGIQEVVEVGVTFQYDEININAQFAILEQAAAICVPDSVFFHAACALNKKVNLAYFARGPKVYRRVKPLHSVPHKVVYKLRVL